MSSNEETNETNEIDISHINLTEKERKICEPSIEEMILYYTIYPIQFFRDAKNMDYKTIFIVLFTFIVNLVIYASVLNYIFNKVIN